MGSMVSGKGSPPIATLARRQIAPPPGSRSRSGLADQALDRCRSGLPSASRQAALEAAPLAITTRPASSTVNTGSGWEEQGVR